MQISPFLFVCVIATFAIIEAVPWYRQGKSQRYEETSFHGSSKGLQNERYTGELMDRDVELITSTISTKRGGGYNNGAVFQNGRSYHGNHEYQGGEEEEQGIGEDLEEHGYPGGRQYQAGYGKHNDRGTKSRRRGQEDSSVSDSEDEDEVEDRSKGCKGCRYKNIGNGRRNYNRVYMYD